MIETGSLPAPAPRTARALLVGIFLLAAALRVSALSKPYYVDEISTLTVASQSLDQMAGVMRKIDASPALYPLTLHYWIALSHADAWVRLLSALFGLAAVWAAYRLTRLLFGERTAIYAALIVALAPIHVEYAQYVRSYSLFTFVTVLQVWAFSRCLVPTAMDTRRVRPFVWLALATAAMFYTHYLSMLMLIPEGVYALWRFWNEPRRVAATGAAVLVAGILFVPGVPLLQHNLHFDALRNADRVSPPPVTEVLPDLFGELTLGRRELGFTDPVLRRTALSAGLALVGASLIAGIAVGWRRRRDATIVMALMTFLPIIIYILSGRKLIAVRFFLPCGIALLVLVAHGMASAGRRWGPGLAAALALVCLVPIGHFVRSFTWSYDRQAVATAIRERWQPGDIILSVHPFEILSYRWYLGPEPAMMGLTFTPLSEQQDYVIKPAPLVVEEAKARVRTAAAAHPRVWVIGQSPRSFSSRDEAQERELLAWMDGELTRADDLGALTHDDPVVRLYRGRAPGREPAP